MWVLVAVVILGGCGYLARRGTDSRRRLEANPASRPVMVSTARAEGRPRHLRQCARHGDACLYRDGNQPGAGQMMKVNYHEGQMVQKGDSLLEIDPRPYQAALTQVAGTIGARSSGVERSAHRSGALSTSLRPKRDRQAASGRSRSKPCSQDEGTVKNDQGQVENAKVNLVTTAISLRRSTAAWVCDWSIRATSCRRTALRPWW